MAWSTYPITILFERKRDRIVVLVGDIVNEPPVVTIFPASNNASSDSKGRWPQGVYTDGHLVEVTDIADGSPDGKYGQWFLRFPEFVQADGKRRIGMGLHAGRLGMTDRVGRKDWRFATMGCVRTTDDAMAYIASLLGETDTATLCIIG